jgi:hypothetical protein
MVGWVPALVAQVLPEGLGRPGPHSTVMLLLGVMSRPNREKAQTFSYDTQ